MANDEIKFELRIEGEEKVVAALKEVEGRLGRVENAQVQTAAATTKTADGFESLTGGISAAMIKFNAYVTAAQTVAAVVSAVAERVDELNDAQEGFNNNADEAAGRLGGLVSKLEIMQTGARQTAMGLQLTNKEFGDFLVFARQYSERTGKTMKQVTDELTQALVTGREEGFKRFNLEAQSTTEAIYEMSRAVGGRGAEGAGLADGMEMLSAALSDSVDEFLRGLEPMNSFNAKLSEMADLLDTVRGMAFAAGQNMGKTLAALALAPATMGGSVGALLAYLSQSDEASTRTAELMNAREGVQLPTQRETHVLQLGVTEITGSARRGRTGQRRGPQEGELTGKAQAQLTLEEQITQEKWRQIDAERQLLDLKQAASKEAAIAASLAADDARNAKAAGAKQLALQQQREQNELIADYTDRIGGPLLDALDQAAAGEVSFGKAMQANVASTLRSLGKEFQVKALGETAAAIASLAVWDLKGAGNHAAAAGAYEVAALGAAAAGGAMGKSSGSSGGGGVARSSPSRDMSSSSGSSSGSTYVINWNQPAVLAGTYAEAGRKIKEAVKAADNRFGV